MFSFLTELVTILFSNRDSDLLLLALSCVAYFLLSLSCHSACLVQRTGWTRDMDVFFDWLSALPFSGGGFSDVAIAEGLAEALMVFGQYSHTYSMD